MKTSYKKLWVMLIEKDITKVQLKKFRFFTRNNK